MGELAATSQLKEASIEAVVIRADGSVEDLGVVSYWSTNPFRRLWWRLTYGRS
jgi:hypothetical protein